MIQFGQGRINNRLIQRVRRHQNLTTLFRSVQANGQVGVPHANVPGASSIPLVMGQIATAAAPEQDATAPVLSEAALKSQPPPQKSNVVEALPVHSNFEDAMPTTKARPMESASDAKPMTQPKEQSILQATRSEPHSDMGQPDEVPKATSAPPAHAVPTSPTTVPTAVRTAEKTESGQSVEQTEPEDPAWQQLLAISAAHSRKAVRGEEGWGTAPVEHNEPEPVASETILADPDMMEPAAIEPTVPEPKATSTHAEQPPTQGGGTVQMSAVPATAPAAEETLSEQPDDKDASPKVAQPTVYQDERPTEASSKSSPEDAQGADAQPLLEPSIDDHRTSDEQVPSEDMLEVATDVSDTSPVVVQASQQIDSIPSQARGEIHSTQYPTQSRSEYEMDLPAPPEMVQRAEEKPAEPTSTFGAAGDEEKPLAVGASSSQEAAERDEPSAALSESLSEKGAPSTSDAAVSIIRPTKLAGTGERLPELADDSAHSLNEQGEEGDSQPPLQDVWAVQRVSESIPSLLSRTESGSEYFSQQQGEPEVASKKGESRANAAYDLPLDLEKIAKEQQINAAAQSAMQTVQPARETEASVHVMAPRRARPIIQRKEREPRTQGPPEREVSQPLDEPGPAVPPLPEVASGADNVSLGDDSVSPTTQNVVKTDNFVETDIGVLPDDLWALINEPPPLKKREPKNVSGESLAKKNVLRQVADQTSASGSAGASRAHGLAENAEDTVVQQVSELPPEPSPAAKSIEPIAAGQAAPPIVSEPSVGSVSAANLSQPLSEFLAAPAMPTLAAEGPAEPLGSAREAASTGSEIGRTSQLLQMQNAQNQHVQHQSIQMAEAPFDATPPSADLGGHEELTDENDPNEDAPEEDDQQRTGGNVDISELVRQVYSQLRKRLVIERERIR